MTATGLGPVDSLTAACLEQVLEDSNQSRNYDNAVRDMRSPFWCEKGRQTRRVGQAPKPVGYAGPSLTVV